MTNKALTEEDIAPLRRERARDIRLPETPQHCVERRLKQLLGQGMDRGKAVAQAFRECKAMKSISEPAPQGGHEHPHGPDGMHKHASIPDATMDGGHDHEDEGPFHRHRRGDPMEGGHPNGGQGIHRHLQAEGLTDALNKIVDAHYPKHVWIPGYKQAWIRHEGEEVFKLSTKKDWTDHALWSNHSAGCSANDHWLTFNDPATRFVYLIYELEDGTMYVPDMEDWEEECAWFEENMADLEKQLSEGINRFMLQKASKRRPGESLQDCVSRKIAANIKEGRPRDQAIAVAFSQCGAPMRKDEDTTIEKQKEKPVTAEEVDSLAEAVLKCASSKVKQYMDLGLSLSDAGYLAGAECAGTHEKQVKALLRNVKKSVPGSMTLEEYVEDVAPFDVTEEEFNKIINAIEVLVKAGKPVRPEVAREAGRTIVEGPGGKQGFWITSRGRKVFVEVKKPGIARRVGVGVMNVATLGATTRTMGGAINAAAKKLGIDSRTGQAIFAGVAGSFFGYAALAVGSIRANRHDARVKDLKEKIKKLQEKSITKSTNLEKEEGTEKQRPKTGPGSFPFPVCLNRMKEQGHDEDTARKICGAIRARNIKRAIELGLATTEEEAINVVAKKIKEDPLYSYILGRLVDVAFGNEKLED